jgi:hypothetical protein
MLFISIVRVNNLEVLLLQPCVFLLFLNIKFCIFIIVIVNFFIKDSLDSYMKMLDSNSINYTETSEIPLILLNFLKDVFYNLINSFCLIMV